MMAIDELNATTLDELPLNELAKLIDRAKHTHERRRTERAATLKAEFEAKLKAEGFTLAEVLGDTAPAKPKRKTLPPKYAHPDKPDLTWSGLGRKPGWLQELLAGGVELDSLSIG